MAREQEKRWPEAEALYRRALRAAQADPDEFNLAYLEGRLANALLRQDRRAEAKEILERSLTSTSDVRIPASISMLTGLYFAEGRWADAERILREGHQSQATRETRAGRVSPDVGTAVLLLADAGVKAADAEPIARAERWASEAGDRGLWFAAGHRRGVLLEAADDASGAIAHYRGLVDEGSLHEPTYTRLFILLERAGLHEEAVLRARSALQQRWSASFEEQTRKRIARLEARLAPRGRKPAKEVIAAFSVREGTDALRWAGQLDVKGGAQSLTRWADGLLVTSGGKDAALLAVSRDLGVAERLRPVPSRASVLTSPNNERVLLAVNEGTVADGHADLSALDDRWEQAAATRLGGVTSEVAILDWGVGAGSRDGGLYAVDWNGHALWTYRLPSDGEVDAYSRRCPYYVNGAPRAGRVVFTSWSEVICLESDGRVAWMWTIPAEQREWHTSYRLGSSPAEVSAAARLLDVAAGAGEAEVRAAFRRQAKVTHPDTSGRPAGDFVAVRDAYETLLGRADTEASLTFTMTMSNLVTSVRATTDGGAFVGGSGGQVFRLDGRGRVLVTHPGSDSSAMITIDRAERLAAVSDWDGVTIPGADGHPAGGFSTGQLLKLSLSDNDRILVGYAKKDLYLFSRGGSLVSHAEFSRTISDVAWLDDTLFVAAGKVIALSTEDVRT